MYPDCPIARAELVSTSGPLAESGTPLSRIWIEPHWKTAPLWEHARAEGDHDLVTGGPSGDRHRRPPDRAVDVDRLWGTEHEKLRDRVGAEDNRLGVRRLRAPRPAECQQSPAPQAHHELTSSQILRVSTYLDMIVSLYCEAYLRPARVWDCSTQQSCAVLSTQGQLRIAVILTINRRLFLLTQSSISICFCLQHHIF